MTTLEPAAASIDPGRVAELAERQRAIHRERTAGSGRMYERAATVMPGGVPSSFQRNDPWPVYLQARRGLARVGRRRQRVHRLPQRLRRHVRRPRQPRHRRRRSGADGRRHALRGAHRGLDRRGRGAPPPLGPGALALHQLGHRVDDGRDPPRPRGERPPGHRQDRGHLPRPSRRRDGLRQAARRRDGRPRPARLGALRRGLSGGADLAHARGAVQRRRRARGGAGRGRGRRRDPGAGDDEREHRAAGARATSSACASSPPRAASR